MKYLKYITISTTLNLLFGWLLKQWLPLYQAVPLAYLLCLLPVWYLVGKYSLKLYFSKKVLLIQIPCAVLELIILTVGTFSLNIYLTDIALGQVDFQLSQIGVIKTISHAAALLVTGTLFYPLYRWIHKTFINNNQA